jgi:hypothetical protein
MMAAVAFVGLALGAGLWSVKMRRLAHSYALRASANKQIETAHRGSEARLLRRVQEFDRLAQEIDELRRLNRDSDEAAFDPVSPGHLMTLETGLRETAESFKRKADHYAALSHKYENAARFPWRAIGPDPSEPE